MGWGYGGWSGYRHGCCFGRSCRQIFALGHRPLLLSKELPGSWVDLVAPARRRPFRDSSYIQVRCPPLCQLSTRKTVDHITESGRDFLRSWERRSPPGRYALGASVGAADRPPRGGRSQQFSCHRRERGTPQGRADHLACWAGHRRPLVGRWACSLFRKRPLVSRCHDPSHL